MDPLSLFNHPAARHSPAMLALLIALLAPPTAAQPTAADPLLIEPLVDDTWIATDREFHDSKVLIARMPDGTAVIVSSPFEDVGATRLLTWIRKEIAPRRIVAINPHFHFDGTGGNAVFNRAGVSTWSSDLTRALIEREGLNLKRAVWKGQTDPGLRARMERMTPAAATHTFPLKTGKTFDFGGEKVIVSFPGEAHSPDNVVIDFPKRRILFGGCMIKPGKSLGYLGAANLSTWPHAMRALKRYHGYTVIAGHVKPGGYAYIERTLANAIAASPEVKAARKACVEDERWQSCLELVRAGAPDGKALMAAYWRSRCKPGVGMACDQLGLYTDDVAERVKVQTWACDGGAGMACYSLSLHYTGKDAAKAGEYRQRACALKNPDACEEVAIDRKLTADAEQAAGGCVTGDMPACHAQGEALRDARSGDRSADWAPVHAAFGKACDAGYAPSCRALGDLYGRGWGVAKSYADAAKLHTKACAGDDAEGCEELASLYAFGDGVQADDAKAYRLYTKACRLGNEYACSRQGDHLVRGKGVEADPARGTALRLKACRAKEESACETLAKQVTAATLPAAKAAVGVLREMAKDDVAVRFGMGYLWGAVRRQCEAGEAAACMLYDWSKAK